MSYAAMLANNGGMATCGDGLGVFVGDSSANCPPGWVFVDKATATEEVVSLALKEAKRGRAAWPEKS